MKKQIVILALAAAVSTGIASAQTTYHATLTGSQEVPANASTATGSGTVVLNAAQNQIIVDESWTGLTTPATLSHIHGPAAPGVNAGVLFGFTGVPSATSGSIPEQTFAITPAQVAELQGGLLYMNVHDSTFGGGEIRGQLTLVPEPSTWALLGVGLAGVAWRLRRKKLN
jgi:hypothetical protein